MRMAGQGGALGLLLHSRGSLLQGDLSSVIALRQLVPCNIDVRRPGREAARRRWRNRDFTSQHFTSLGTCSFVIIAMQGVFFFNPKRKFSDENISDENVFSVENIGVLFLLE